MTIMLHPDRVEWRLPPEFNIYQAAELKSELECALGHELPLACVLSDVEDMDGAALQLLIFAQRECGIRRIAIDFLDPSAACREACTLMGFTSLSGGVA